LTPLDLPPGAFLAAVVPDDWESVRVELTRAFEFTKQAAQEGVPVVYVVRSEDLFGRRGACPAMIACGLLSAARTAGIEGLKSGWSVNILAVDEGVVDGEVERWAARLTEGGGPTGELVRLGGSHLGRLQP